MNAGELLTLFRSEMADAVEPYLWSDEEFYIYLDDAQIRLCRETDGIADATTPEVTQLQIVAGQEWYEVDRRIKKLRLATRAADGANVAIFNPETALSKGVRFNSGSNGRAQVIVWGLETGKVRVWPKPTQDDLIELSVFRLPLAKVIDEDSALEVDERHHLALLDWVKRRAYLKQDAETLDRNRAADFEASFDLYCKKVLREQSRERRSTGTTTYGGL